MTPLAARLAAELGLSLADLEAEPGVRIRAADLLAAAARAEATGTWGGAAGIGGGPTLDFATGEVRGLNRVRRITAERMAVNWQAPQVTYTTRADMTRATELRADLKGPAEARGTKLSYDAMFVRAVATALLEFPQVNARWAEGQGIIMSAEAHVGVAVDLGDGLIVPVVRNAHTRGLLDITAEVNRLVGLARRGQARTRRLQGRYLHHQQSRTLRGGGLHPHRQSARSGDPGYRGHRSHAGVHGRKARGAGTQHLEPHRRPPHRRWWTRRPLPRTGATAHRDTGTVARTRVVMREWAHGRP